MFKKTGYTKYVWLAASSALLCSAAFVPHAYANPEGGQVISGAATITETANKLDIHQTSNRALIDWRSFNIANGEHTQFHQPSSTSVTVNRISDPSMSNIRGKLSANGNLVLINPNGIMFGDTATVDVNGIVATTAGITNANFAAGHLDFNQPGSADAQIINNGTITAADAGLVGLVAPQVENNGLILANMGRVQLSSAETVALDFYGDGLLQVAVSDEATAKQLVKNTGAIEANGGTIALTAATARNVIDSLIQVEGELTAPVIEQSGGKIIIRNETAGGVSQVAGHLKSAGGDVEVTADKVGLMAGGTIDVSATNGGGNVRLGGDWQGGGTTQRAQVTYVDSETSIKANATEHGDGGQVVVWADDTTRFYGAIEAQGGANGGHGGNVEVSGKRHLNFQGEVSTIAANGENGQLLLDPTDITISNAADQNMTGADPFESSSAATSVLNVTTLETALAGGHVTVRTIAAGSDLGDITVADPITWTAQTNLALEAHNDIYVNAAINGRNNLALRAQDIHINAPITDSTASRLIVNLVPNVNTSVGVAGAAGDFNISNAELDLFDLDVSNSVVNIGSTGNSGTYEVAARNWGDAYNVQFRNGTGQMLINGTQNFGTKGLLISTRNLSLNADLISTGGLQLYGGQTIGVAGAAGELQLTDALFNRFTGGWSSLLIQTSNTINVNAYTWNFDTNIRTTGTGTINILGDQNTGSHNLTIRSENINIGANLIGTGDLFITPNNSSRSLGLAGATGDVMLSTTDLDHIVDGWNEIRFGQNATGSIIANAYTWRDDVRFAAGTGVIDIQGAQTMGTNSIRLDTTDLQLNANIIGNGGTAWIVPPSNNTTVSIAGGTPGTLDLAASDFDWFTGTWDRIAIGHENLNVATNIGANTWDHNIEIISGTGTITVEGAQDFQDNNFTLSTNADAFINAQIDGTGIFHFQPNAAWRSIGVAGAGASVELAAASLDNITSNWAQLTFGGGENITSGVNLDPYPWRWDILLQSGGGQITLNGAHDFQGYDLDIRTNANFAPGTDLQGTGNFSFAPFSSDEDFRIAEAGGVNFGWWQLGNFADTWNSITFGRADSTGDFTIGAFTQYDNDITFTTSGTLILEEDIAAINNGSFTFNGSVRTVGNRSITTANGNITFSNALDADSNTLSLDAGTGDITLNATSNLTDLTLAGADLNINNTLTADSLTANMTGTLNLGAQITANDAGNALVLAGNSFVNTFGANLLQAPNGRWLVYTASPTGNTRNGLLPDASEFNKTLATDAPATLAAGNRFIYSTATAPVLVYQVNNGETTFDTAFSGFSSTYVSGLLAGDTTANIGLTGTPAYANSYVQGSTVTATPMEDVLTATTGSLSSVLGYDFSFLAGDLTVTEQNSNLPTTVLVSSQLPYSQVLQAPIPQVWLEGGLVEDPDFDSTAEAMTLVRTPARSYSGIIRMSPKLRVYLRNLGVN